MPRPKNTARRRDQIARALLEVMAERGYEGSSVAAIAQAADLTPGLVHYHFPSKEHVLLRAIELLGEDVGARVAARLERSGPDPGRRLEGFIDAHLLLDRDADPRSVACWVAISAEAARRPAVQAAFRKLLRRESRALARLVREALAERHRARELEAVRESRRGSSRSLTGAILAAIHGYLLLGATAPEVIPRGSAAASTRALAAALLAQEAP